MKKILFVIITLACTLSAMAQEKQWNILKHDPAYICGEGVGATKEEADKNALADLTSQIVVSVTSLTSINDNITEKNGVQNEVSQFKQSVETYSSQTLNNTQRFEMYKSPNWRVGRAIKKADVDKMFEDRAAKARDMVLSAEKAEKKGRVDDALRNYYWALTLLKSLQSPNAIKYTEANGTEHTMTVWIKEKMEDIFDDIKVTCVSREGDDVDVDITYHEKPVNSAGFTYFDGRQWTSIVTACDGFAKLEFVAGYSASTYKIRLEYQYKNEAKSDKELESVLKAVNGSEFRRSGKEIRGIKPVKAAKKKEEETAAKEAAAAQAPRPTFTSTHVKQMAPPKELNDKVQYQTIVEAVEKGIRNKSSINVQQYFTSEGWDIYQRLIDYGQAKLVGVPQYRFFENGEYVTARGLMLSFSFKNGTKKSFVEEVIFTFDSNRQICNISFGLGRTAEDDILNKGAWDEKVRLAIMDFLENYKTAYALKRLDYIQSIFDEDAIIITGRIVKKANLGGDLGRNSLNAQQVTYNKQTKQQYMENLRKCFASNEFVNINFSSNDVRKGRADAGQVYGIQIEQDYHSSSYGDHGYLFLLVDMNDAKQPIIKVRTWQPQRDPNMRGGLYGIDDFKY